MDTPASQAEYVGQFGGAATPIEFVSDRFVSLRDELSETAAGRANLGGESLQFHERNRTAC